MLQKIEYPQGSGKFIQISGMPWKAVASDQPIRPPPTLGQHTEEILKELNKKRIQSM
jgi:crotonobetainyl-CoA:carnitine CoA-transferase CaiB-like acyl-CoA transferase